MFRSFTVKQRRSIVRQYGAIFKCMASRAVHIEVTCCLDTNSFIPALQRLVAWQEISDQSTQIIEVISFLLNQNWRKHSFLQEQCGDWFSWHKIPPLASHMGGVWEQEVRSATATSILRSFLRTHRECLDDESSLTIMTEIEGILNFRSPTVEVLNHPTSLQPL